MVRRRQDASTRLGDSRDRQGTHRRRQRVLHAEGGLLVFIGIPGGSGRHLRTAQPTGDLACRTSSSARRAIGSSDFAAVPQGRRCGPGRRLGGLRAKQGSRRAVGPAGTATLCHRSRAGVASGSGVLVRFEAARHRKPGAGLFAPVVASARALTRAARDPDESVRNNATRAIWRPRWREQHRGPPDSARRLHRDAEFRDLDRSQQGRGGAGGADGEQNSYRSSQS